MGNALAKATILFLILLELGNTCIADLNIYPVNHYNQIVIEGAANEALVKLYTGGAQYINNYFAQITTTGEKQIIDIRKLQKSGYHGIWAGYGTPEDWATRDVDNIDWIWVDL